MEIVKYQPEVSTESGIHYRLIDHPPVQTLADVRRILHVEPSSLVKVMILREKRDDRFFVAALPGDRKLDWKKFADVVKVNRRDLNLLDKDKIEITTGLTLGGIRPFGYDDRFSVVFDRAILANRIVYCSAGEPTKSMKIGSADLLKLSGGRTAKIIQLPKLSN